MSSSNLMMHTFKHILKYV